MFIPVYTKDIKGDFIAVFVILRKQYISELQKFANHPNFLKKKNNSSRIYQES